MAEWQNGGMAEWRNGRMADGMAEWQKEWQNGRMVGMATYVLFMVHVDTDDDTDDDDEWQNGRNGYICTIYGTHRHQR